MRNARGILLWGPPGTGKTLIAQALAHAHGAELVKLEPGNLLSKWVGETEHYIKKLFEQAKVQKTILFIDEVDSFLRSRQADEKSWERTQKTQFLESIQDFLDHMTADSALVACTNTVDELDAAMKRRFKVHVFCGLPNEEERKQLLKHFASKITTSMTDEDFANLASRTQLYSGSDIARLVQSAQGGPVAELQNATHFLREANGKFRASKPSVEQAQQASLHDLEADSLAPCRPINFEDFEYALVRAKATLTKEEYKKYLDLTQDQNEATTQMREQSNRRDPLTLELARVFCDEALLGNSAASQTLAIINQFQRYAHVVIQPGSSIGSIRERLVVVFIALTILTLGLCPTALWLFCGLLCGFILFATVIGPLAQQGYLCLRHSTSPELAHMELTKDTLRQVTGLVLFLFIWMIPSAGVTFSGIRVVDTVILAHFVHLFVDVATSLVNFFSLRFGENTREILREYIAIQSNPDLATNPPTAVPADHQNENQNVQD
eukprot:m.19454 g.19454  ORF g.19454 m.19454 type:complete len:495 (+) comp12241_c0_seq1:274-1758(+)